MSDRTSIGETLDSEQSQIRPEAMKRDYFRPLATKHDRTRPSVCLTVDYMLIFALSIDTDNKLLTTQTQNKNGKRKWYFA